MDDVHSHGLVNFGCCSKVGIPPEQAEKPVTSPAVGNSLVVDCRTSSPYSRQRRWALEKLRDPDGLKGADFKKSAPSNYEGFCELRPAFEAGMAPLWQANLKLTSQNKAGLAIEYFPLF